MDPHPRIHPLIESSSLDCRYLQNAQINTGFLINKEENAICLPEAPLNIESIDTWDNGWCRHSRTIAKKLYEIGAAAILARIAGAWYIAIRGCSDCVGI